MTKKDYRIVAKVLKDYWESDFYESVNTKLYKDNLIEDFCIALKENNPNFNADLFREECGR